MPKTRIFAVAQQKGGTGKTTTAHAIGAGLAQAGKRVLFIDLDGQKNLTYTLKALNRSGATAADVLAGTATAESAIIENPAGDLAAPCDLIPASDKLAIQPLTGDDWQFALQKAIEPIKSRYDIIVIDTPPQLGQILACTLTAATDVIIPTLADFFSFQGVNQILQTIEQARTINPTLKTTGILITKYSQRKALSRDTAALLDQTAKAHKTKVFKTKIRECIALAETAATQTDIFTYAPKSNAATDYNNLLMEIK